jgi:hypothetical protein
MLGSCLTMSLTFIHDLGQQAHQLKQAYQDHLQELSEKLAPVRTIFVTLDVSNNGTIH